MVQFLSLNDVKPNDTVKVLSIQGNDTQETRLSEIGIVPGTLVKMMNKLPFQGPLAFLLRGSKFALRQNDARCIRVQTA